VKTTTPFVFRPSRATYKSYVLGILATSVILAVVLVIVNVGKLVSLGIVSLVIGGAAAACIALFFRNTKVTVVGDRIQLRNLFGHVSTLNVAEFDQVLNLPKFQQEGPYMTTRTLGRFVIVGKDGKRALDWSYSSWSQEQMLQITGLLDIPAREIPDPVTIKTLRKTYPRLFPWWMAHTFLSALLVVGLAVVVVIVIAISA
jgi:hypothetical protein